MTPSKQPIKEVKGELVETTAMKALRRIEEMGLNRFQDSYGIWDVKTKRVDPASLFDVKTTPAVIAGMLQQQVKSKEIPTESITQPINEGNPTSGIDLMGAGELMRFCQSLWLKNVIDPKFQTGEDDDVKNNILSINHVSLEVLMEYLTFQLSGAASVAVKVGGGETSLANVADFPSVQ